MPSTRFRAGKRRVSLRRRRQPLPRFLLWAGGDEPRPFSSARRPSNQGAGRETDARLERLSYRTLRAVGVAPIQALWRRPALLLQLGRGGRRDGDKARPPRSEERRV